MNFLMPSTTLQMMVCWKKFNCTVLNEIWGWWKNGNIGKIFTVGYGRNLSRRDVESLEEYGWQYILCMYGKFEVGNLERKKEGEVRYTLYP